MKYFYDIIFDNFFSTTVLSKLYPIFDSIDESFSKGSTDLVELGYLVTMNVTADISGIDVPKDFAKTRNLLKLVKIFSEGATLVHSLKNKKIIRQIQRCVNLCLNLLKKALT